MEPSGFVDYYEILEISPNADSDLISRVFRALAARYHPDNKQTGDLERFSEIVRAHDTLRDPLKRAQYDVQYKDHSDFRRQKLAEEANDSIGIERDADTQEKLLSILYVRRRQDIHNPGIGEADLERLSGCPRDRLEFNLWYLKQKGWIGKEEDGTVAITVEGVDRANSEHRIKSTIKLLTNKNQTG